jgi:hypothetical protein
MFFAWIFTKMVDARVKPANDDRVDHRPGTAVGNVEVFELAFSEG